MENDEKTENLINGMSEEQLQRIAERIKEIPKRPIPRDHVKLLINYGTLITDNEQEAKKQRSLCYRENLKKLLQRLYSFTPEMSPDQLAFANSIKNKFLQNGEMASKDEFVKLSSILKSVSGHCGPWILRLD